MPKDYPRVLIFGQGFNTFSGGCVTLINLFKGWPKDKIASVVSNYEHVSYNVICDKIYGLKRWRYPISKLYKSRSGEINLEKLKLSKPNYKVTKNKRIINIIFKLFEKFGILPFLRIKKIPHGLLVWIKEFNPDIIYTQLADVNIAVMVSELSSILNKPLAIHIMDDWPKTIYRHGFLSFISRRRMEKYFLHLINKATVLMCISEYMAIEYQKRYKKNFLYFHNHVEISSWSKFQKSNWNIDKEIKILYIGRFGIATKKSIYDMVEAIQEININGYELLFEIFTPDYNMNLKRQFEKISRVRIHPSVPHDKVPELLSTANILFLPLDFDSSTRDFIKYSIPTKATEYMASGVPILVYAPKNIALTEYAIQNKCALVISTRDLNYLKNGIITLIEDSNLREKIAKNAMSLVEKRHSASIVRNEFREALFNGIC
ncbi:MAG: glycosyltransferase family 4 protein [Parcubacteria group bacterium]|nr:glycosyltransferase family 4 protein [Parcubacteria group bacterium]